MYASIGSDAPRKRDSTSSLESKNRIMRLASPPPRSKVTKGNSSSANSTPSAKKQSKGKKKGSRKEYRPGRRPRFLVWDESYQELLDYMEEHGHCHVPQSYAPNERLGRWVARQRTFYRQWQDYKMLQESQGIDVSELLVDAESCDSADMQLFNMARPITSNPLATNQTRIALLEDIGFAWNLNDLKWEQRLKELLQFKKEHKHCNVPVLYKKNRPLGTWVNNQRLQYKGGYLSSERIKKLEAVGFAWSSQLADQQWEARFEELQDFFDAYGHVNVPEKYEVNQALAYWVTSQRKQYKKMQQQKVSMRDSMKQVEVGEDAEYEDADEEDDLSTSSPDSRKRQPILTKQRIEALNSLGFVWNIFDARWKERYDMLVEYKEKHGDCLVPSSYPENPELACWVLNQRTQYRYYRNGESTGLTEDRINKLEQLGFVWHDRAVSWNSMLEWMERYIESHPEGSSFVPPTDIENRPLRIWAKNQRYDYKKMSDPASYSPMSPERVDALNRIGFQWVYQSKRPTGPSVKEWSILFDKLREKGIAPEAKAKTHWFDGESRPHDEEWDTDVYKLWNDEEDEDEDTFVDNSATEEGTMKVDEILKYGLQDDLDPL